MGAATLTEALSPSPATAEAAATMVVFGATGDLAQRRLYPALYNLAEDGLLSRPFTLIGSSRSRLSDGDFRRRVAAAVRRGSRRSPDPAVLDDLLSRFHFVPGPSEDPGLHTGISRRLDAIDARGREPSNRLFYLSTAPELFGPIVVGLGRSRLQRRRGGAVRLLIEKPFGRSAAEARAFDETLLSVFGEDQIYRVDHYLGKEEVQNILALRFANAIFEPFWNREAIASVQLTAAEDLGVGARAGYYDRAGALRDHLQNHLLQLLCMTCMEPPSDFSADAVRDEKVRVLEAVGVPGPEAVARGQYTGGVVDGERVPGYAEEAGVARGSRTETYVAMRLAVQTPRWEGIPIYLRTGKRLARKETEIAISLRPAAHAKLPTLSGTAANELVIDLRPSGAVRLTLAAKVPGVGLRTEPITVELPRAAGPDRLGDAYERLLLDGLRGDATLFTRRDEVEQQWRVCDPILARWSDDETAPALYSAGSQGPAEADLVLAPGDSWRSI